jgi:nitroreductase
VLSSIFEAARWAPSSSNLQPWRFILARTKEDREKFYSFIIIFLKIGASTNKVEAYNGFSKWLFFGGDGIISENDPEEQEKRIKYNDLVANAVIFQNVCDITLVLWELSKEGYVFSKEDGHA